MTDALLRSPPDIVPLQDAPAALEPLVRRYEAECYYGRGGPGDAEADLRASFAAAEDALRAVGGMLLPRGWRPLGRAASAGGPQTVYRKAFADAA